MVSELKIISWNVNGFRAVVGKGFFDFVREEEPDILCIQETKAQLEQIDTSKIQDIYPYQFFNSAEKKGYSGTGIFSKIKPINVSYGIDIEHHNTEGRVITAEYDNFYLVTVYTPNSQRGLTRLEYRQTWDNDFLNYVKELEKIKPVIFCGDLNVAHKEIDLKNPQTNKTTKTKPGNAGFTDEERAGFDNIVNSSFIDTFRYLYPDEIKYTWWSYMFSARLKNVGWRIDYFCISDILKTKLVDSQILTEVMGSDHCPIVLKLKK